MLYVRPARLSDLLEVKRLAAGSLVGVTSLPDDGEQLAKKIADSEAAFAAEVGFAGEESYFFVLEDSTNQRLFGCSAIVATAGAGEPFYNFRNETFVHASRALSVSSRIHVLSLCHDLSGSSLLASFYIDPSLAKTAQAELVSRVRLLFAASFPERFADTLVAEIVGFSDGKGRSPFWEAVGRNFFDTSYVEAERLCASENRTFLAELMPHYPLYVPLLPDEAQAAIGQVHPRAQLSFDILSREGFETERYIDPFTGGPCLLARTTAIRSMAQSQRFSAKNGAAAETAKPYLVCNGKLRDFRALLVETAPEAGALPLPPQALQALAINEGDPLRAITL